MSSFRPPIGQLVLLDLHVDQPHLRQGLAAAGVEVRDASLGRPPGVPVVIVTDRGAPALWHDWFGDVVSTGQVVVIGLGDGPPFDLRLPPDFTVREVELAVTLLAQIVALRRQQQRTRADQAVWIDRALRDALTELPNRRAWQEELPARLVNCRNLCVALLDVDVFKTVNDQHGFHVGDTVLRELAAALRMHVRAQDYVARLGGDEFGLILCDTDPAAVGEVLERVRLAASRHLRERSLPALTLSAGCVTCSSRSTISSDSLFAAAAEALREAKHRGRNCSVTRTPPVTIP